MDKIEKTWEIYQTKKQKQKTIKSLEENWGEITTYGACVSHLKII